MQEKNEQPLYIISVAAELLETHPQTLRFYERKGLITPKRQGKNRLYSNKDIERIKFIQRLTQESGVNLAGIRIITELKNEIEELKNSLEEINKKIMKDFDI